MDNKIVNGTEYFTYNDEKLSGLLKTLSGIYYNLYEINLTTDKVIKYHASKQTSDFTDRFTSAHECLLGVANNLFLKEFTPMMVEFFDSYNWPTTLKSKDVISVEAKGIYTGWERVNLIVLKRDKDNTPTNVMVALQNINAEKMEEIRKSKEVKRYDDFYDSFINFNEIVSRAGLGIWYIILKDGRKPRMQASSKMAELLDIDARKLTEEEIYSSWYDNITPEALESVNKSVGEMIAGKFSENTYRWRHPSKGVIYVRCAGTCVTLKDGTHILSGYHCDVTDVVLDDQRHQQELEIARNNAEKANNAKTKFLFNMSHDIRTPMNAIMGYTNLIDKHIEDKELVIDYLKKIRSSSDFLLSLINNVLEMARIESGKITLDESVRKTESIYDEIIDVYSELARNKGLEFNTRFDVKTPYIYCDDVKLNEVLLNIVSNAYKYTLQGGKINFSVKEIPSTREGWINIVTVVEDTGIGMSKEYLPVIFDEFSREHNETEIKIKGTGLGMPIVKRLVQTMNGTIQVESELGKGSKFTIVIPHRIASAPAIQLKQGEKKEINNYKGRRILLAEDNDFNAEIAIEILKEAGLEVERAEDGVKCVDMLAKNIDKYYDAIIMDIQMPNLNGYEATRRIRSFENKAKANIPIIAMTANAFEEDKRNALNAGMNDHLAKPINVKELMGKLSNLIN